MNDWVSFATGALIATTLWVVATWMRVCAEREIAALEEKRRAMIAAAKETGDEG